MPAIAHAGDVVLLHHDKLGGVLDYLEFGCLYLVIILSIVFEADVARAGLQCAVFIDIRNVGHILVRVDVDVAQALAARQAELCILVVRGRGAQLTLFVDGRGGDFQPWRLIGVLHIDFPIGGAVEQRLAHVVVGIEGLALFADVELDLSDGLGIHAGVYLVAGADGDVILVVRVAAHVEVAEIVVTQIDVVAYFIGFSVRERRVIVVLVEALYQEAGGVGERDIGIFVSIGAIRQIPLEELADALLFLAGVARDVQRGVHLFF